MTEPEVSEPDVPLNEDKDTCWLTDLNQGNLLKGIDDKTVKRKDTEPIKRGFNNVLFSVTGSELHFLYTVFPPLNSFRSKNSVY